MSNATAIRISTDPAFDLHEAGEDTSEADSLYAAWSTVLTSLADAIGVEVEVARGGVEVLDTCHEDEDGERFETVLWQTAHDHVRRTDSGEWVARQVRPALVGGLRQFAKSLGLMG